MEINYDEELLLRRRVDLNNEQTIFSQVLRIAVYNKFKAYETYSQVIEKFGLCEPFVSIKEEEAVHYSVLVSLLEKYSVVVPTNNLSEKIEVPDTLLECCELAVASQIENITMYDNLLSHTIEEDIKDVLFKLQAASYNNHLPTFRNAVFSFNNFTNNQEINQEDLMQKFGEYQSLLDDFMTGNIDQNKLTELFSKLNISMITGVGFGSAAVALLNSYINNKNNKE